MKNLLTLSILFWSISSFGQSIAGKFVFDSNSVQISSTDDFSITDNAIIASGTCAGTASPYQYSWITSSSNQQVNWSKKIQSAANSYVGNVSVEQLNDSHDVIVCIANADINTNALWYELMRLDSATGNVIWSKKVVLEPGLGYYIFITPLQVTEQNEILVTQSIGHYLYAAKFNENGVLFFSKRINNIGDLDFKNPGFSFIQTSDGGYLGTLKDDSHPSLVKLNADFSIAWSKLWTIEGYSHPRSVIELSNGKFAVGGIGDLGHFIAVLSSNGIIESYTVIPDPDYAYGFQDLTELTPTKLLATGYGFCFTLDLTTGAISSYLSLGNSYCTSDVSNGIHAYQYSLDATDPNTVPFIANFDVENASCNPFSPANFSSQNVTIGPNQVVDNPPFYIENSGNLMNSTPILEPLSVTLNPGCFLATEEVSAPAFKLFPNPVAPGEVLTIRLEKAPAANEYFELIDVSGNVILTMPIEQSTVEMTIPSLAAGLYFIQCTDEQTGLSASQKLMVK